jgi:vacuolar protein sorting-associated protein 13A/C
MADNFSSFNQRLRYAHLRPSLPVKSDPRAWWKYSYKVVTQEIKKSSWSLSWEQLLRNARLRKAYVSLYASLLKSDMSRLVVDDHEEIKRMDRELDMEVILQWRMLAHKFVEQSAETYQYAQQNKKQSWWSFGWLISGPYNLIFSELLNMWQLISALHTGLALQRTRKI